MNMSEKIKVLIVDDASFMVKAVRDILETDPDIVVIGSAKNGKDALEKIKQNKPDVITLDVDMPIMDGLSAVRHIMIHEPVPIVMLSSLFEHGDITFEALRLGVVDAAAENINNVHRVKLNKIDVREQLAERYGFNDLESIITMGTTLGGPNTIIRLMSTLSPNLPAATVVIQEIGVNILPAFVEEFNKYTPWKVEVGTEGKVLEPGSCYICSYNEPMSVQLNQNHEVVLKSNTDIRKPLNTLFSSAAEVFEQNTVGVLLTGIGSDGEYGFEQIKERSGITIAQNTETCVYPNLTQCAIEHGVVDYVDDANQLSEQIEKAIRSRTQDNYIASS
jgi:two-component system chemotaxis response regulator CheB